MEHELKFSLVDNVNRQFRQQLNVLCAPDQKYNSNQVNSVYFDTPELLLLLEKASSDYLKTKLRLRWYDDFAKNGDTVCYLELKEKIGSSRKKHRLKISLTKNSNLYQYLESAEFARTKQQFIEEHCIELLRFKLSPNALISYQRSRYIDKFNQYRISFDEKIMGKSFLNKRKVSLDQSIFEIKGLDLHALPENLRDLSRFGLKKVAFSKYYECCTELDHYQQ